MRTNKEKKEIYERSHYLLSAMFSELQGLSRKKPDGALNKTKIRQINRLLEDLLQMLKDEPDTKYLELLNEDDVPTYSDVSLLLSQFDASVREFRKRYTRSSLMDTSLGKDTWNVEK